MNTCIVTGANGFIGRAVVSLLKNEWKIFALSRQGRQGQIDDNINYIPCDLAGIWDYNDLPAKIDAVVYLAQSRHFRGFPGHALDIFSVNTDSLIRLIDYAYRVGAKHFVYASTGGINGFCDMGLNDDSPIGNKGQLGFYFSSKISSELLIENYAPFINVILLRYFFVYGPYQRSDMFIPRLIDSIINGSPIVLHGEDGIFINPTYITDAASAVRNALRLNQSHKIAVGGPEVISIKEIGYAIGKAIGKEPVFKVQQDIQPEHMIADIKKMSLLLGCPLVKFNDGILNTISTHLSEDGS